MVRDDEQRPGWKRLVRPDHAWRHQQPRAGAQRRLNKRRANPLEWFPPRPLGIDEARPLQRARSGNHSLRQIRRRYGLCCRALVALGCARRTCFARGRRRRVLAPCALSRRWPSSAAAPCAPSRRRPSDSDPPACAAASCADSDSAAAPPATTLRSSPSVCTSSTRLVPDTTPSRSSIADANCTRPRLSRCRSSCQPQLIANARMRLSRHLRNQC